MAINYKMPGPSNDIGEETLVKRSWTFNPAERDKKESEVGVNVCYVSRAPKRPIKTRLRVDPMTSNPNIPLRGVGGG